MEDFNIYIKINILNIVMKKYLEFILESKLIVSDGFREVLSMIDDQIARDFESLIDKDDIRTSFNAINISDTNDTLWFSPDSQFQRKFKNDTNIGDIFSSGGVQFQSASVARVIRNILGDNGKEYLHSDVVFFFDKYKAAWTLYKYKLDGSKEIPIRVVSGDEIKFWYSEDSYCKDTLIGKGSLGKSCMRYDYCQDYFDIYTLNPKKCQLVIMTDMEGNNEVLRARALLWKTSLGYYLDRIYFTEPVEPILMEKWIMEKYEVNKKMIYPNMDRFDVKLDNIGSYNNFPYMDTLCYYYSETGKPSTLFNYAPNVSEIDDLYYLQDTDGAYEQVYNDDDD